MVSQLFTGDIPQESRTVENHIMENLPANDEKREDAHEQFKLLKFQRPKRNFGSCNMITSQHKQPF